MEYMTMEKFREIYAQWQESGQSVRTFTAALGMEESKFYYWQKKLKEASSVQLAKAGGFIPMGKPMSSPQMNATVTSPSPALCELVYPNGVMLRITSDLSIADLRSLIFLSK